MDKSNIIRKIKRCLALSESSNETEAATAMRQAQAMMREHNLSEADISASDVGSQTVDSGLRNMPRWRRMIAETAAKAFGCQVVQNIMPRKTMKLIFIGVSPAADLAAYAYDVLLRQAKHARAEFIKIGATPGHADDFCEGWAMAVRGKITGFAAANATEKNALMVIGAKHDAAIDAWIAANLGEARTRKGRAIPASAAHHVGAMAGKDAQLHQAMSGRADGPLAIR